jgi:methionyl-tRNA formyltransferase
MRIAFFGYDFFLASLARLIEDGHELRWVFTVPVDNVYNYNRDTLALAKRLRVPVKFSKPSPQDIDQLRDSGVDLALCMAYDYKIPTLTGLKGVNLHPTLLPEGRGVWPLPWLILQRSKYIGLTTHKITNEWDAGDIIGQVSVEIPDDASIELLAAKLQMAAPDFVSSIVENLDTLWDQAWPQGDQSSTWAMPSDADRVLNWESGVASILRTVRAFGKFESTAIIEGAEWMVTDAEGWLCQHGHRPGSVAHRLGREIVIAASDGFVLLRNVHKELDFSRP